MFPGRNGFYSYQGLVQATSSYPSFAATGDDTAKKREIAAFLANVNHETGGLVYIEEIEKADYCSPSPGCPCAPGKRYYGRGPIQISWNFNYCAAGAALGLPLQSQPELVAQDSRVAWQTGLWFWMTSTGAGSATCHNAIVGGSFGQTIQTINGSLECGGRNPGAVQSRVDAYRRFCSMLGVDPGANVGC
jgi:chitinase